MRPGACSILPRVICLALVLVAGSSVMAFAQDKTDVVTLRNADHLTGDVASLSLGRLSFKTNDAGTISIEWDKVLRLQSAWLFEVRTSDGRSFVTTLGQTEAERILVVAGDNGPVLLPLLLVTEIHAIGKSFWNKLDGSIDGGFNYTQSSGISQTTFNAEVEFRRPAFVVGLTTSATITDQGDGEKDDRGSMELAYVRYRGRRQFVNSAVLLETNESLGLVLRSQAGVQGGLRLVNTNRAQFGASTGLVVNNEESVDGSATQNLEAVFAMRTSYFTYDSPKTNANLYVQYFPSLSQWGRQRVQLDASLKRELLKDFMVGFTVYNTYDSKPPNEGASHNDVGIGITIGWTFGR